MDLTYKKRQRIMSSGRRSFLDTPLLASAILLMAVFGLVAIAGVFLKVLKVSNWELFMQIGFLGEALGLLLGVTWAVRALWRYVTGKGHEPESV